MNIKWVAEIISGNLFIGLKKNMSFRDTTGKKEDKLFLKALI